MGTSGVRCLVATSRLAILIGKGFLRCATIGIITRRVVTLMSEFPDALLLLRHLTSIVGDDFAEPFNLCVLSPYLVSHYQVNGLANRFGIRFLRGRSATAIF